ncbi:MAG: hypothetical protein HY884_00760 [Deltaproteobacteria bacterium]|nr:hypothetical protein [Deltaproteobacteria bacterium]
MRGKQGIHIVVLFISVFAMNANAFSAGIYTGGRTHVHELSADGQKPHYCHHFPQPQVDAASHHDKDHPQVCRTSTHEKHGQTTPSKPTKIDGSGPIIECNCVNGPGIASFQAPVALAIAVYPSPALNFVAVVATDNAPLVLSEFVPPEQPPRNTL